MSYNSEDANDLTVHYVVGPHAPSLASHDLLEIGASVVRDASKKTGWKNVKSLADWSVFGTFMHELSLDRTALIESACRGPRERIYI